VGYSFIAYVENIGSKLICILTYYSFYIFMTPCGQKQVGASFCWERMGFWYGKKDTVSYFVVNSHYRYNNGDSFGDKSSPSSEEDG